MKIISVNECCSWFVAKYAETSVPLWPADCEDGCSYLLILMFFLLLNLKNLFFYDIFTLCFHVEILITPYNVGLLFHILLGKKQLFLI